MGVLGSDSESNINPDSVSEADSAPDPEPEPEPASGLLIAKESPIACSSWVWV